MYLLCARHLHLHPSLFFKYTDGRELNKDIFRRHVSIWSSAATGRTSPASGRRRRECDREHRGGGEPQPPEAAAELGSIQRKAEASTARADHCITQACCFLNLTTDIKLVGVRCCHVGLEERRK
ncbi:hypothetical protein Zmor_000035 [Zophobas morio]|uniref:Uncharacterized protein n=1 Tax=Zophobas morio TaxID=2755281 RepID=A0AA38IVR2_9CUCU|nr:hypothetical protein Zmor_000035 [Zophobas morio]